MIDPTTLPWYGANKDTLEEFSFFSVGVAGKTARVVAKQLDRILSTLGQITFQLSPYDTVRRFRAAKTGDQLAADMYEQDVRRRFGYGKKQRLELADILRFHGMGCYNQKSKSMMSLVDSGLDLMLCSVNELDALPGIGPKTARFFVLHTRPNVDCAVLDTHILRWMGELGFKVPKSTPTGKRYAELEEIYLAIARLADMEPAKLDITLWNWYAMSIGPTEGNAFIPTKKWLRDKLGGKISVDALLKAV